MSVCVAATGDWTAASGKAIGGGVCVFISKSCCGDVQTVHKYCSPDMVFLMMKCHPNVFLAIVYIPLQANSTEALGKLHNVISTFETTNLDIFLLE